MTKNNSILAITFFLLVIAIVSVSCAGGTEVSNPENHSDSKSVEGESIGNDSVLTEEDFENAMVELNVDAEVEPLSEDIKVEIRSRKDYEGFEAFSDETVAILERVVNSIEFKRAVQNPKNPYAHDRDLSPQGIYDLIRLGHEVDGEGGAERVMDLRMRTITLGSDGSLWVDACNKPVKPTIGKDGGGTGIMATCPNWIERMQTARRSSYLAGHYMHEYLHTLEFKHPDRTSRLRSVPYQIGYMVERLGTDYGKPLTGTVTNDQKFRTMIDGTEMQLNVYRTSMHERKLEPLYLSNRIGQTIKLKVQLYTDTEAYGAVIVR